jgi:hypothetical protein
MLIAIRDLIDDENYFINSSWIKKPYLNPRLQDILDNKSKLSI